MNHSFTDDLIFQLHIHLFIYLNLHLNIFYSNKFGEFIIIAITTFTPHYLFIYIYQIVGNVTVSLSRNHLRKLHVGDMKYTYISIKVGGLVLHLIVTI